MTSGPYARAAALYADAGWHGILPLPPRRKKSPPEGYTGEKGVNPSRADVQTWSENGQGRGNIALRMPLDVVGIDVDLRDGAATTLDGLGGQWGQLPKTVMSTSRDEGSGIRLFKVPSGLRWRDCGDGVQTLWWGYRYVVVWPSIHPEGREYHWIDERTGEVLDQAPTPHDLPELPQAWVDGLTGGKDSTGAKKSSSKWTDPDVDELVTNGIPAGKSQHDALRDLVWKLRGQFVAKEAVRAVWQSVVDKTSLTDPGWPWTGDDFERHWAGADEKLAGPATPLDSTPEKVELPRLHQDAFHGIAGHIVKTVEPFTEADPAAVLVTLLAACGAIVDRHRYVRAGDTRHPPQIWPLVIGKTAGGSKGTSWAVVNGIIRGVEVGLPPDQIARGLSSGEGLIEAVRDPSGDDPEKKDYDAGVSDKRLLVVETEFGAVLGKARREGSVLSETLRQAWDGGRLATMSRKTTKLVATNPHIVIVGHITPTELRMKLTESDVAGGLLNRFLPVYSTRSKRLANGGSVPEDVVVDLADKLSKALSNSTFPGVVHRDEAASALWEQVYVELTPDLDDGHVAAVVARAAPQTLRLALVYALLDDQSGATVIRREHLKAALAVWRYVEASARYVFGDLRSRDLNTLCEAVDRAGDSGLTRTDIVDLFGRNKTRERIDELIRQAVATGQYEVTKTATGGRPAIRLKRSKREKSGDGGT